MKSDSHPLAQRVLAAFRARFGDIPVRLFRAPGRINLRGMHVDTHGGFLNLMTHQREVVLAVAPTGNTTNILANVNADFAEVHFDLAEEQQGMDAGQSWWDAMAHPGVAERVRARRAAAETAWSNYCIGAALRIAHAYGELPKGGLMMMMDSDLPRGAALSSSAALTVAALLAYGRCNGIAPDNAALIWAAQDVEWYAGARIGMSDQAAILLGQPDSLLHVSLFARDFSLDGARHVAFPPALDLLVVNSHTRRALSGAQRLQYALNRFAYSMALTVLQVELRGMGWSPEAAGRMDRLSRITPEALGGNGALYRMLQRIPVHIDLESLRRRYDPPALDDEYGRYFGELDAGDRPEHVPLRGPLLFGIAESERARQFPKALESGDYEHAGQLMTIGHDGDRVCAADGVPFSVDIGDGALEALARDDAPVALQPGAYGASSPALDALVDSALAAGALGASLTGAGIAGAVLALCQKEDSAAISRALARTLQQDSYARIAQLPTPLDAETAAQSVVVNQSVAGAGELVVDA